MVQALQITLRLEGADQVRVSYWGDRPQEMRSQPLPLAPLRDLLPAVQPDGMDRAADLERLGRQLFHWLQGAEGWLGQAINDCSAPGLVLALSVDDSLAHLPWEALHDGSQFLVERVAPIVALVRWLDAPVTLPDPAERSLQLLFMATAPETVQPTLDFEAEEAGILHATQEIPLNLRVEESGCLEELAKLWGRYPEGTFDVFHLTGHAGIRDQTPYFITETQTGDRQDATAADLFAPFQIRRPRLVFLSGCRTGQSGAAAVPSLAEAIALLPPSSVKRHTPLSALAVPTNRARA